LTLTNVVKFCPEEARLRIEALADDGRCVLTISSDGTFNCKMTFANHTSPRASAEM